MASIFTYETEQRQLISPWGDPVDVEHVEDNPPGRSPYWLIPDIPVPQPILLPSYRKSKLPSEPQDGSIEYKLHLLLRPRQALSSSTTGLLHAGLMDAPERPTGSLATVLNELNNRPATPSPTLQARQSRLLHLTTQLLWRLQQSASCHTSSSGEMILPILPDLMNDSGPPAMSPLHPGLQDTIGALYEIGVADDGALVGLTKTELANSLTTLRYMAASLGCQVDILRVVEVGRATLVDDKSSTHGHGHGPSDEALLVAEALVSVYQTNQQRSPTSGLGLDSNLLQKDNNQAADGKHSQNSQLRVVFVGNTNSGKSSLIGTLTSSVPDNGRGSARISMLKHPHEISSGITSSLSVELIGYTRIRSADGANDARDVTEIVNYHSGNITTWVDIHGTTESGRLAFLVDTAGTLKYRRTAIRGLLSWRPHWTFCCIPADSELTTDNIQSLPATGTDGDLDLAHFQLTLRMGVPMALVITRSDLLKREKLKDLLITVTNEIKAAGRSSCYVNLQSFLREERPRGSNRINLFAEHRVEDLLPEFEDNPLTIPIVFTSSLRGWGIDVLHSLLRLLPVVSPNDLLQSPQKQSSQQAILDHLKQSSQQAIFNINDVFVRTTNARSASSSDGYLAILSGICTAGTLHLGDTMLLGPLPEIGSLASLDDNLPRSVPTRLDSLPSHFHQPVSRRASGELPRTPTSSTAKCLLGPHGEGWIEVRVTSLRNLRKPVTSLYQDQTGTVCVEAIAGDLPLDRLGKGQILLSLPRGQYDPTSAPTLAHLNFSVAFKDDEQYAMEPGAVYNIYTGSVRAVAKIVSVESDSTVEYDDDRLFELDSGPVEIKVRDVDTVRPPIQVNFELVNAPEVVSVGEHVIVIPGHTFEKSLGLDCFVGTVVKLGD